MRKNGLLLLVLLFLISLFTVQLKPIFAVSPDSWIEKAPVPTQRYGLAVTAVNSKIYAVGGILLHGPINTCTGANEVYDPLTDTWIDGTAMPTPRVDFGIAVYENKIYCIGGATKNRVVTGINEVYDPAADTWTTRSPMPVPRDRLSASMVNGKTYLMGGSTNENLSRYDPQPSSLNEVYDPQTDTWTTKMSLPTAVYGYVSAVVNDKIYVIGGNDGNGSIYLTQIYNPVTDQWNSGFPIPENPEGYYPGGAGATTGVYAPKRIYVFGGTEEGLFGRTLNTTLVYDPEKDAWSYGAPMITGRSDMGVAVVNDLLYAIGGVIWWGGYTGANEQYTPFEYGTPDLSTPSPSPEPTPTSPSGHPYFPLTLVTGSVIAVVAVGLGLLVYLKKRQKTKSA